MKINKTATQIIVLSLFATTAYADSASQSEHRADAHRRFELIGRADGILASLGGEDAKDPDAEAHSKLGYAFGAAASLDVDTWVALQAELLYTSKGANLFVAGVDRATLDITYFTVPVLARGKLPIGSRITPYLIAGPELGFLLSALNRADDGTFEVDVKDRTTAIDVGFIIGIGVGARLPHGAMISFEARYIQGLRTIDDSGFGAELTNRVFSLGISYRWDVRK